MTLVSRGKGRQATSDAELQGFTLEVIEFLLLGWARAAVPIGGTQKAKVKRGSGVR